MKVTEEMLRAFSSADFGGTGNVDWEDEHVRIGLKAVLALLPDVQPFAFAGFPDNPVYIHPCGEVVDVSRVDGEMRAAVDVGDCDCEGGQPWQRIYVKNEAKA